VSKAVDLYKRAAEQGHSGALNTLANCYLHGRGVDVDEVHAADLYQRPGEHGNTQALVSLGGCYLNGWGVHQDEPVGLELLTEAALKGSIEAENMLFWYSISSSGHVPIGVAFMFGKLKEDGQNIKTPAGGIYQLHAERRDCPPAYDADGDIVTS
jgi:hypothetical protein